MAFEHMTTEQLKKHFDRLFELADMGHRGSDLAEYGRKVEEEIRRRESRA